MRATRFWPLLAALCIGHAQQQEPAKQPQNTSAMASHYGHGTPPLSVLTGMDQKPFSLEPLKGHWTLLYFWADWCLPCIQEGIPALTRFVHATSAYRETYRIVAIRFNSPHEEGDWNTFHDRTLRLEQTVWHGVPPFPIVYDSSTKMTTDWGIHALPTYALIDPEGNLVRDGNLATLEAVLEKDARR